MNRFLIAIVFIVTCAAAAGQTATISADKAADAERAAINAERSRSEADYLQEQKACYQKFAVNDCLRDAGERHRKILADLRRREIALNDAERKRQAAEQARNRQEKAAAEQQKQADQQSEDQRAKAAQNVQQRQDRAASSASDRAKAAAGESKNVQDAKAREQRHLDETASQAAKAAAAAKQRADYDEKIRAAAERKADRDRRRQENPKPPANPLPTPP
ncbi:MAG: hypothetical protein P4L96_15220 [Rhodoferax sp.]|nr:hypothetical protein [Rhodoferax sp.]